MRLERRRGSHRLAAAAASILLLAGCDATPHPTGAPSPIVAGPTQATVVDASLVPGVAAAGLALAEGRIRPASG